jgi:hypothetical protein
MIRFIVASRARARRAAKHTDFAARRRRLAELIRKFYGDG